MKPEIETTSMRGETHTTAGGVLPPPPILADLAAGLPHACFSLFDAGMTNKWAEVCLRLRVQKQHKARTVMLVLLNNTTIYGGEKAVAELTARVFTHPHNNPILSRSSPHLF